MIRGFPKDRAQAFLMDGRVRFKRCEIDNANDPPRKLDEPSLNQWQDRLESGDTLTLGQTDQRMHEAIMSYPIADMEVGVHAMDDPLAEAFALHYRAMRVVVLDEWNTVSEHPDVEFVPHADYDDGPFDLEAFISLSRVEHFGLGRYGEEIDPDGDLKAMTRLRDEVLRPGKYLYLSVPIGQDSLVWNAHRIYGRTRLPLLLSGWEVVDTIGFAGTEGRDFLRSAKFDEDGWYAGGRKWDWHYSDEPVFILTPES